MIAWPVAGDDVAATAQRVHTWALLHFVYVRDEDRWKGEYVFDHWETDAEILSDLELAGVLRGDCDAFAKLCWMALRRVGVKARLVQCIAETGEGHLVCEAQGWVLDNRHAITTSRDELERAGYQWIAMSGFEPFEQWTRIKP